ncbi:MAG: proline--tRNA ligase [Acidobacteria bacterium]|nr:proline--tRNA ligase [Acidobacteriota bacterium]
MHRWSRLFIPTLREAPADAVVASHQILVRAGYIRQLGAGIYNYLFLGTRSINKIVAIVREEMDKIGQEFYLPALNPAEIWQESGRWTGMGENMFRLKDRKGADLCLGMTHEEVMTSIARDEVRSYKQLPQIWYQIQTKFRDEPRPKSGLLRVRQFTMKDSYSFDIDEAGLDVSYRLHDEAYRRIFTRCGLEFVAVEADSGAMGGSQSQEFMVYTEAGEDLIASSPDGKYAANIEKATALLAVVEDLPDAELEEVHTPGQRTIEEVGAFLKTQPHHQVKTMAMMAVWPDGKAKSVVAFLRGDHQLNETKLASLVGGAELRPMQPEEIASIFNAPAGYLGPIGLKQSDKLMIVLDKALEGRRNLIAGANKEEFHLRNVTPGVHFNDFVVADVRTVTEGEPDPIGGQPLRIGKAVEIGHIFKLGYKYTESMGARVLDQNGKEVMPIMGCYGIGIERILTSAMELSAAKKGLTDRGDLQYALPPSIAPFEVVITVTKQNDASLAEAGEKIARDLEAAGFDVLLDDRDQSAGVKFKDADLIGVPYRVNIGKKLAEGKVELVDRLSDTVTEHGVGDVVAQLKSAFQK